MGLRFRKSFKIAPGVKLNFNKKSTGVTFGGKGFHYTINSKGRKTTTVGVPGTGLYYTSTSGGGSSSKKTAAYSASPSTGKKPKKGCLIAIIIFIAIPLFIGIIGGIFGSDSEPTSNPSEYISEEKSDMSVFMEDITEQESTTEKSTTVEETTTKAEETTTKTETTTKETATTQQVATTKAATTTTQTVTTTKQTETTMKQLTTSESNTKRSYVLNTSTMKFHYPSCGDVGKINSENRADVTNTRDNIISNGYSPCGHCKP